MGKEKIETFMNDLKELCNKHKIDIHNVYNEPIYLTDEDGILAEYVDFENYTADLYEKGIMPRDREPITLQEFAERLRDTHKKYMEKHYRENGHFNKVFKGER